ncbi:MAG: HD-GYP domain-containing protein [Paenibacillaceae bacterium]|nr:HD-GYP domain-containing protein [Paenibacillaceae bacterium]
MQESPWNGASLPEPKAEEFGSRSGTDLAAELETITGHMQVFLDETRLTHKLPITDVRQHVVSNILRITEQPDLYELFVSIQANDAYDSRHHVGVGIVASLIGRWIKLEERDLLQLATAATLHDIGKIRVPQHILNKRDRLSEQEFEVVKQHTVWGYELIRETVGTSHRQALVALQHHERLDGSGYPLGLQGDKIDLFSRIVAVADVFHAMMSTRVYKDRSPFYEVLREMRDNAFGSFDPQIAHLFYHRVMHSLLGNEVSLTDGRTGVIVLLNQQNPLHPLVRVEDDFVDLSRTSELQIEHVMVQQPSQ